MSDEDKLAIYQGADGAIELPIDAKLETIWVCYQWPQAANSEGLVLLMLKVDNRR